MKGIVYRLDKIREEKIIEEKIIAGWISRFWKPKCKTENIKHARRLVSGPSDQLGKI